MSARSLASTVITADRGRHHSRSGIDRRPERPSDRSPGDLIRDKERASRVDLTQKVGRNFPRGWKRGSAKSHRSARSEEHTSELQSRFDLVCRLRLEKKKQYRNASNTTALPGTSAHSGIHCSTSSSGLAATSCGEELADRGSRLVAVRTVLFAVRLSE